MSAWNHLIRTKPMPVKTDRPPRRRRRWLLALALLLLLLIGVGVYGSARPRGSLARVQKLQQELFGEAGRKLPPQERQAKSQQLRQEVKNLSPQQRSALFAEGRKKMAERLDHYFAMSPAQKKHQLDEDIDRTEQARRNAAANGAGPGGRPGGPGGPGGPGANGGRPRTAEEIERRRKERLQNTTPEQRAEMDQFRAKMDRYRQDLNARRQQRGLPPMNGPGRPR